MKMLALVLCLAASGAQAQSRPMTPGMTCAGVQQLVSQRGAVVLGFGPDLYDRVVSGPRYCQFSEGLVRINVPTRDTATCFAGYTCRETDNYDN